MDFTDVGTLATEVATANAVELARQQTVVLAVTGHCRNPNCGDKCETRFCNASCRNEWEKIQRLQRLNGRT